MRRQRLIQMTAVVLVALFCQLIPAAPVRAQEGVLPGLEIVAPPDDIAPPPLPDPILLPPVEDPHLPSLVMRLTVTPEDWVVVGDVITATISVWNQADDPAEDVALTLPLPSDAAAVDAKDATFTGAAWTWSLGKLAAGAETTVSAQLRLTAFPIGGALPLQPAVIARGLDQPSAIIGGALVTTDDGRAQPASGGTGGLVDGEGAATLAATVPLTATDQPVRFTPGQAARITSRDGRVTVDVPADAFDQPLTMVHRTPVEQRPHLRAQGKEEPPSIAGFRRGFGTFYLEATDDQGQAVHRFKQALTVTYRFTPQQLQVLGSAPGDLRFFWFDEDRVTERGRGPPQRGAWVVQPTQVDAATGVATLQVDHFSPYSFGDGSSPSAAYLPSLQGWQVSGFTGAASYSFPFHLPAGPGGIKPDLTLSYSSDAMDGSGGVRLAQTSSWVGRGWSLDTGSVALNKLEVSSGTTINHYALSFGGRSYDLIRGEGLVPNPNPENMTHWAWRPTDESFLKARVLINPDPSAPGTETNPGVGAMDYSTPYTRSIWRIWDKSGTLYEFKDDIWWGWANCNGSGQFAYFENNRWMLSSVTDTFGNTINYTYGKKKDFISTCNSQYGTVDFDVWPSEITWGKTTSNGPARYRVTFETIDRTIDTQFEWPAYELQAVRDTQQLQAVKVWSNPAGSWQLVREYRFTYDDRLRSDTRVCINAPTCSTWGPNDTYKKLTLLSIQQLGNDGVTALPAMTFSYNTNGGTSYHTPNGWNRLNGMNNGQGGTLALTYDNLATVAGAGNDAGMLNRYRVTSQAQADGQGNTATWSYSYGTPQVNALGTNLQPGSAVLNVYPNSATLYYNKYLDTGINQEGWLAHQALTEFRGHSWMQETDPSGAKVKHWFYQGDVSCGVPTARDTTHALLVADSCFQQLRDRELLKGREYLTEVFASDNSKLSETSHAFKVGPVDYSYAPLSGLWRAFRYESQVSESMLEGGTTPSTRTTKYYYGANAACSWTATLDAYGNMGCIEELDGSTVVRKTLRYYVIRNDETYNTNRDSLTVAYLVDRVWGENIYNGSNLLALTHRFYDTTSSTNTIGTVGALWMARTYFNVPGTCCSGVLLKGQDTVYGYDAFGNQTSVTRYAQPGTLLDGVHSAPGNGSAARTTTIAYDGVFHAFSQAITDTLGLVQRADYDYRMGTLVKIDGPNGSASNYNCLTGFSSSSPTITTDVSCAQYDVFGRLIKIRKPEDTGDKPTLIAAYVNYASASAPFSYRITQREDATTDNVRYSVKFYDGLGRQIQTKAESQGFSPYKSIVSISEYDGLGRTTRQSEPLEMSESGSQTLFTFTPTSSLSGLRWTQLTYDGLGRTLSVTAPDNAVTHHRYAIESGFPVHAIIDAKRHLTRQRMDALGRLVRVDELNGNCGLYGFSCGGSFTSSWIAYADTDYTYTPLDQLDTSTDMLGNVINADYDSLGRKTKLIDPDMGTWYYDYDVNGNLRAQTSATQGGMLFQYDAGDRLTSRLGLDNSNVSFGDTFNSKDTTNWSWSTHQTVPFSDGGNNVVKNTGTGSGYAAFYRTAYSLTSGEGLSLRFKVSSTSANALWRLESNGTTAQKIQLVANSALLQVQHSSNGTTYVTNAENLALSANAWYRLFLTVDDVGGISVHVFRESDPSQRLSVQVPLTAGQGWRFLQAINTTNTAYTDSYYEYGGAVYGYDNTSGGNFGKGQRTSMSVLGGASTSWAYDNRGRLSSATHSGPAWSGDRVFSWGYDSADRVTTLAYPTTGSVAAETVTYVYDSAWRQTSVCSSLGGCYAQQAAYEASGAPDHWKLGNNLFQNWMYDAANRPIRLQLGSDASVDQENDSLSASAATVFDRQYAFDGVGNITSLTDKRGVVALQSYSYDDRDRLTGWTLGGTPESYSYNPIGNLTSKAGVTQSYGSTGNGTGAGPHQARTVGGNSYTYDGNGNLTSGGGRSYVWTATNLPYQVTHNSVTETYGYDADDGRVTKLRSGTTTVYLGGLWEETVGGAVRKYYTLAGQTVALRTIDGATNPVTYMQGDHLGSVSVVTTQAGVATTQEFDPWGKVRTGGITQTTRNFTGQILDDTGLLFYNARYYDSAIGRFLSADTVVPGSPSGSMDGVAVKPLTVSFHESAFRGKLAQENALGFWFQLSDDQRRQHGSPMGPAQPQALNRYSYVLNNPMRWTDPTGHTVYLSQEQARVFVDYLRQMARELTNRAEGRADNVRGVIAAVAGAFSGVIGNIISKLFLNLEALKWEQIAKVWEIADTIATVNDASPDGVALAIGNDAGAATSGDYPNDLYVLNRTTGEVSTVHLGWLMSGIIFGFGLSEWNLGMAFGDPLENGKYVFADDIDGRGLGPGNVCPPEAISC